MQEWNVQEIEHKGHLANIIGNVCVSVCGKAKMVTRY